ncbi:lysophospholipid acyltransferase family protein [Lacticaseibacillus brantae]|uniref:1-acyl-sn-glycerol-3-phosphate acyltransferase n=1 Tax=Lacticaseibacillus brantae DSM 23927 TaxID=1423727 RepID=A0A0R2B7P6_9LACO|nr:lysophospholipid acyltransferase family protein [Lacticaseibacillus brantae]KRM72118.1 1-acyl-sn-glycerol-3-phosphate acyltransferase [Lacticaseibacillus brantae DSM 23927]
MRPKAQKTMFYHQLTDDIVITKHQDYQLPPDYRYQRSATFNAASHLLQSLVKCAATPICRWIFHTKIENKSVLAPFRGQGMYIYGNHTSPVGDVFVPFWLTKRPRVLIAPVNLKLPIIGSLLPLGGVIPIPGNLHQYRPFLKAVTGTITNQQALFIYPEAHVWPYATTIRPFATGAFRYPIETPAPVFCMTTTYQHSRWHRRPRATIYVDGPFYPDESLPPKARQRALQTTIHDCMVQRSQNNTYEYIHYQQI